jgi:hypothetical protein
MYKGEPGEGPASSRRVAIGHPRRRPRRVAAKRATRAGKRGKLTLPCATTLADELSAAYAYKMSIVVP